MSTKPKDDRVRCKVWFCTDGAYSSGGYCPRHQRQQTRSGDPLAGRDALFLNKLCVRLLRLMRKMMGALIVVDHNDIAHCRVCDSHSAPHGRIQHKEGCAAHEARDVLLSYQRQDEV